MEAEKEQEVLDTMNGIKNQIPDITNRAERRKKKKYFTDLLKKHMSTKPTKKVTLESTDEEALEFSGKIRNWMVRKAILERKIDELS